MYQKYYLVVKQFVHFVLLSTFYQTKDGLPNNEALLKILSVRKILIEYNKNNFESLEKFNNITEELNSLHTFLKQHKVDNNKINKLNEDSIHLIEKQN